MFAAEADSESVCQGGPHDQYTTNLTCEGKCDGSQSCPPVSILIKNLTHNGWKKKTKCSFFKGNLAISEPYTNWICKYVHSNN